MISIKSGISKLRGFAVCIIRQLGGDYLICAGETCVFRDPVIPDGVTITIEDTGEMYLL